MVNISALKTLFGGHDTAGLKRYLQSELNAGFGDIQPNWHPLGFVHAKLAQGFEGETYRLHIWPADKTAVHAQEHKVHDHLFDVESIVLTGAVQSIEYELRTTDFGHPTHRVLRVDYAPSGPRLYEDGATGTLVETMSRVVTANSSYKIMREVLHETTLCSSATSVTLVHTSNPAPYDPRIAIPIGACLPPSRAHVPFSKDHWLQLLFRNLN